ncbi:MAG TPA: glycosyltransferase family 2 protein [Verrucomicrobiae bacterium]|nr:glycosyltransferase family 2 protein [Verrucomicrobiae bacterium]
MKTCFLIPAYNCAHVIGEVIKPLALSENDEIIVVDDASSDDTLAVASRFPRVHAVRNPVNLGYGGTSQRLYELAVERKADYAISIHGDLGHRPEDAPLVLAPLYHGDAEIVLGSRLLYLMNIRKEHGWSSLFKPEFRFGMPLNRVFGHFGLTWFQNRCFGTNLHSFHDGMRACTRPVMEWVLQNQFSTWYNYDTDLIVHAHRCGLRISEVAVKPFYHGQSKSAAPSFRYGLRVVRYTLRTMGNHASPTVPRDASRSGKRS